jgi:hypothetical protein
MGYTRRQIINASLEEIGLDPINFDITSSEYQRCLRRLDSLISKWKNKNIDLGYVVSENPSEIDIDAETEIESTAWDAVYLNLAVSIAPSFGKKLFSESLKNAQNAYNILLRKGIASQSVSYPQSLPRGAGSKAFYGNKSNYFVETPQNKQEEKLKNIKETFETVSKNLKSYPYTLNYTNGNLTSIVYDLGDNSLIVKTLNYTNGVLTSIVLSGDTPNNIELTKNLNYNNGEISSIVYS